MATRTEDPRRQSTSGIEASPGIAQLLERARGLGPLLREHPPEAEISGRLPPAVMEALAREGLQRMYVPRALGGLELSPLEYARVAETIAGFDAAAGWALQVGNTLAWWAARLPEEGVDEIYGDGPDALIAGSFHPPQPTTEVEGGYRVSGRAPLASNIHEADWVFLTGIVMDGDQPRMDDGAPRMRQLILEPGEVEVVETWDSLGMRGTDSQDIAVDDVFVPARRTFPLVPEFTPGRRYGGPLYRFPGVGALCTIFAPVALAIGRAALEDFRQLATEKTPFGFQKTLRERTAVQAAFARADAALRSARALFYETVGQTWERVLAGDPATLRDKGDLLMAGAQVGRAMTEAASTAHDLAGTSGIYAGSPLERHFRDAHTLRHHGFIASSRFETAGQIQLELPPEFAMVHF